MQLLSFSDVDSQTAANLMSMPVRDLREVAKTLGCDISGCLEKSELVEMIRKVLPSAPTSSHPPSRTPTPSTSKDSSRSSNSKRRKHRKSDNPRRHFVPFSTWNGIAPIRVDNVPEDIDETVVYVQQINDANKWLKELRDRRNWDTIVTLKKRKGFDGLRRRTTCLGSFHCVNGKCKFKQLTNRVNSVQWVGDKCGTCGERMRLIECKAVKLMECKDNNATVYHHGHHTCTLRPKEEDVPEEVNDYFRKNPQSGAAQATRKVMTSYLESDDVDWDKLYEIGRGTADQQKVRNAKGKIKEEVNEYGGGMEAVANLRRKVKIEDEFLIYKMNDENMNGERTFVFKMSKVQADLALSMDIKESGVLCEEYCYGDGTFKRCPEYITLNAHTYHPVLRKVVKLATMETTKEGGESKEAWTIFWNLFNEVRFVS